MAQVTSIEVFENEAPKGSWEPQGMDLDDYLDTQESKGWTLVERHARFTSIQTAPAGTPMRIVYVIFHTPRATQVARYANPTK